MRILVTGGSSKLATHIKYTFNCEVDTPSKYELNLNDLDSIENFIKQNTKQYTHVILNGYGRVSEFSNYKTIEEFKEIKNTFLNIGIDSMVNQLYLLDKLKDSLVCTVFMITGVDYIADNKSYNNYRSMKNLGRNLVFRHLINSQPSTKCIAVHPGHLTTEEEYSTAASKIYGLITTEKELLNLHTYHFNKNAERLLEDNSTTKFINT